MTRDEQLKKTLEEWTEEVIRENPEWVAERRTEYLRDEGIKIIKTILYWMQFKGPEWWTEAIYESCIAPELQKLDLINKEVEIYQKPVAIDYDSIITDWDIDHAKNVDCALILPPTRMLGGKNWVICPFHNDHKPSMLLYKDHYHCYTCGAHGNAIDLVRHLYGYGFKEAVKYLRNY